MTQIQRPHRLERSVLIQADPAIVFRYFTDSARWASWWGAGSAIEARVGGRVLIRHPGGVEVVGEVLAVAPPEQIAFTYSMASGAPPKDSLVTIRLQPSAGRGTRLQLTHEFAEASSRDEHVQGWRYQVSLFGNLVANEVMADAAASIDGWFAAWSEPDAARRNAALDTIVAPSVQFRDRYSLIEGLDDLRPHLAAVHTFMPGMTLVRQGEVRHCLGTALADWVALGADGQHRGSGTNVFVFGPGARIESVTGLWK